MVGTRTRRGLVTCVASTAVLLAPFVAAPAGNAARTAPRSDRSRAAALVARMTLDEKITELHGIKNSHHQRYVPGIPRLGIPPLVITNGPAGVGPGDDPKQQPATALPAPISLAASFDPGLARRYGDITGAETRDLAESLVEGPDENIARVPVNGRTFEGYGEDPYLDGRIGAADITGIQGNGIIAEVKHYTANNQETNRFKVNERIDDRTLHEIYLPQFEAAVRQGHAGAVMCAYPKINGTFNCQDRHLIGDVLRKQFRFPGFVQSDFFAAHSTAGSAHAGMDLEMPTGIYYADAMKKAVKSGQVSVKAIDALLVRRFATMMRFGLFHRKLVKSPIPVRHDGAFARNSAEAGTVLLKNSHARLPLRRGSVRSVAVIGPKATAASTGGGGSSHVVPEYTVSPLAGIKKRAGSGVEVRSSDGSDPAAAAKLARSVDVPIVMVGDDETEGKDRSSMKLSGNQDELVSAVAKANPHTIVVVKSGAPVLMPWAKHVPAIVEAWYPGEEDGNAVAAVLFGDANPSGKLPITFPRKAGDVPAHTKARYPGVNGVATYSERLGVGYRWYDQQHVAPLFPFGYGLSYTSFAMRGLRVTPPRGSGGRATASVDVTNTGRRGGAEVAQFYVADPAGAGEPPHRLAGFGKVYLQPGQTRRVRVTLDRHAFRMWNSHAQRWTAVPGNFRVLAGDSSRHLPLSASVRLGGNP